VLTRSQLSERGVSEKSKTARKARDENSCSPFRSGLEVADATESATLSRLLEGGGLSH